MSQSHAMRQSLARPGTSKGLLLFFPPLAAHDPADDSFSATLRCHEGNGELYNVTFSCERVTVQSYSELEA